MAENYVSSGPGHVLAQKKAAEQTTANATKTAATGSLVATANQTNRESERPASTGDYTVTATELNVRTGADTRYVAIRKLPKGTRITVYGEENGWLRISNTEQAWVSKQYTKPVDGTATAGVGTATAASTANENVDGNSNAVQQTISSFTVSQAGIDFIKSHEGCRLKAYRCSAGKWTIGYGNTYYEDQSKVQRGQTITQERAEELFSTILQRDFVKTVSKYIKVPVSQNQFDALVSLAYNIGEGNFSSSTLLKKLNAGDYSGAADQFQWWRKSGGKISRGLVNRRKDEKNLFVSGTFSDTSGASVAPAQTGDSAQAVASAAATQSNATATPAGNVNSETAFSSAQITEIKSWYKKQSYSADFIRQFQGVVGATTDGQVSENTINAVGKWQAEKNLEADGKFGRNCANVAGLTITKTLNTSVRARSARVSASGGMCGEVTDEQRSLGQKAVDKAQEFAQRFNAPNNRRAVHYTSQEKNCSLSSEYAGNYSQKHRDSYFYTKHAATDSYYFDCSSLTHNAWLDGTGIEIGTYSGAQKDLNAACAVTNDNNYRIPGDILWRSGHVAIYIGDGKAIDAGGTPVKADGTADTKAEAKTDLSEFKKTFRPSAR